jgi:hypothetical protein
MQCILCNHERVLITDGRIILYPNIHNITCFINNGRFSDHEELRSMAGYQRVPTITDDSLQTTSWTVWKALLYTTQTGNRARRVKRYRFWFVFGRCLVWISARTQTIQVCLDFPQSFEANSRIIPQLDVRFLPYNFQFSHYHPNILLYKQSL